jgi:DNA-binding NarL/FixJ family response regulator
MSIKIDQEAVKRVGVTQREIEALVAVALGETAREQAARSDRQTQSMRDNRVRLLRRLRARNAAHAVALAFAEGVLTVGDDGAAP